MNNQEDPIQCLPGASLLSEDNQILATGLAKLYPIAGKGDFSPQTHSQTTLDIVARLAANLQSSDGRLYTLSQVKLCQASPAHFHFHYEKQP